jgi:hypothetical protein
MSDNAVLKKPRVFSGTVKNVMQNSKKAILMNSTKDLMNTIGSKSNVPTSSRNLTINQNVASTGALIPY